MSDSPRLPPAYRLVALERVDSTNEEAKRLAEQGAAEGTLVWAESQSAGRGRRGRRWESPPGNLYLSLVLRPDCQAGQATQLGMVAAVAMAEALSGALPPMSDIRLKWPNDILVNDRKAGGILLESAARGADRLDWLVLGIGVNLVSRPPDTAFPATCLRDEGAGSTSGAALLEAFARAFLGWSHAWLEDGFGPVRRAWLTRAWRRGQRVELRLEEGQLSGIFADLDGEGALLVELPGGTRRRVTAADVFATP
jgi:BirA family biotin operon repressor/biotin-[acetyl-CoA-carboxylase] ligase